MTLDPATLVVVACIMSLVIGGLLFFSWIQDRRIDALAWRSAACVAAAVASFLYLLGGTEMRSLARECANATFALCYGMSYAAARRFNDRSISWAALAAGPLLWLTAVWGFDVPFAGRVMIISLTAGVYGGITAVELWNGPARLVAQRAAAVVTAVHASYYFIRIFIGPEVMPSLGWTGELDGRFDRTWLSMVGLVILLYVMTFGFLVMSMAKEKTDLEHRRAALIDPLTGVANRRGFMAGANKRLDECARDDEPVAVLLFDLDHFKTINDRYGHQVGDEVLMDFCAAAAAVMPPGSLFGRMGGEEFAAIVGGTAALTVIDFADRVRIRFASESCLAAERAAPTVSIGVAVGGPGALIETLLGEADRALYRAKEAGRNRVVATDGSTGRAGASARPPSALRPAAA